MCIYLLDGCFQGTYNRISNQNLSETAQNPARFFEKNTLAHSVKVMPCYMRKKDGKLRKHCGLSSTYVIIQTMSRHVEERGKTSLQCPSCGQQLEIVLVICNTP